MTPPHAPVSRTARLVEPFLAMEILEEAMELEAAGVDIVHLEVGEPDFRLPPCVDDAVRTALDDGHTHYTHSLGVRELRQEIARHYERRRGLEIDPARVIVTAGSSGALVLLMALLLDPEDEVVLPNPGYACYANFVRAFHGVPRLFAVEPERRFVYDSARVAAAVSPRTKCIVVNSPSNPTAAVQPRSTLESIAALGVPIISDEIYHGLEYGDEPAVSLLELTDDAFVVDGFSKRYAMTGLRVGWLVAPREHVETIQRLQQNLFVCPSSVAQAGALAALREGDAAVAAMLGEYRERRGVLLEGLSRLGLPVPCDPQGAYYVLVDAREFGGDSLRLARRLLREAHVGVTPGVDFGAGAEGWIRLSFASATERIAEGLRRLESWLRRERAAM